MDQGSDFIGVASIAIPYPDWPKNIENADYHPSKGPFTINNWRKLPLSNLLLNTCTNGMVSLKMNRNNS